MSDLMRPIPFSELMNWVLKEYREDGAVFGVSDIYRHACGKTVPIFNEKIEVPFGPAAGPHTQLAQNLIAAYAAGARFFELKTVQTLDGEDLPVSKPCIKAEDECYNVEWSTELYVAQAMDEYIKAWFAIKLLAREFGLGASDGFVFNMSVGYDLKGIQSEKIDRYIEGMKDARRTGIFSECAAWAKANLSSLPHLDEAFIDSIDPRVCKSITISTLHGCPPDEIERIATYLISVKKLNTYIKCNPTLLGYQFARKTLDDMGYDYLVFDDHHFNDDLQFKDAVPMFERLLRLAGETHVEFGVKLTNTFPVKIAAGELPGEEMYMSGKSLFPLSISLAEKIEKAFDGRLRVSFSGGADFFNIDRIFESGIWPITLATTLLKPGGYARLNPMAQKLARMPYKAFDGVDMNKLSKLVEGAKADPHHVKSVKIEPTRKLESDVPLVDCFIAPCSEGCPIHQDIPTYVELVGEGKFKEALDVIMEKNPLPFITGTICSHRCQSKCTRGFYEESVQIRSAKLVAAEKAYGEALSELAPGAARGEKVAVVGGGPGGMAAAFLLARAGAQVTLFEKRGALGGIVRHVIPAFRISDAAIEKDAALLGKLGVEIRLNTEVKSEDALRAEGFTHVIAAIGAWKSGALALKSGEAMNVLSFLDAQKNAPETLSLGENVVVVGGGNTAMDAARAAKRAKGVEQVTLVYRRTTREMPADQEELELALEDGVVFAPLLTPVSVENGALTLEVMKLGARGADGRRSPEPTGAFKKIPADTVIAAIGEKIDEESLKAFPGAIVIGDAKRGPATVVEAIADATEAAKGILGVEPRDFPFEADDARLKARRALLRHAGDAARENERCLGCSKVCENCVDVCPNRANIAISVPGMKKQQVLHLDKMCNECGNCAVFCPYASSPYKDKFTVFSSEADFVDSENQGFLVLDADAGKVKIRFAGKVYESALGEDRETYPALVQIMKTVIACYAYVL